VIHRVIEQWQGKAEVSRLCHLLDVSRSGYYTARQRRPRSQAMCADGAALIAAFHGSGGSYGSRRLSASLRAQGRQVGRYRARSLMRKHAIKPAWRRKFVHTTDSNHDLPIAENVLDRQFQTTAANQAWTADITYIRTRSGWLYLAAVLDLYSRKIVGWAMAPTMPAQLVCAALQMAIAARRPQSGLIVHTDRGSQYASEEHRQLLADDGLIASMSRKGNCWDNAVMERFFLNLKMERVWHGDYANHPEAVHDITDYIVNFYNAKRLHSTLGYISPNQFERCHA
jgi:putative transposase